MVRLDDYSSAQPMRQAGRVEFVVGRQGYYIGRKLEETHTLISISNASVATKSENI